MLLKTRGELLPLIVSRGLNFTFTIYPNLSRSSCRARGSRARREAQEGLFDEIGWFLARDPHALQRPNTTRYTPRVSTPCRKIKALVTEERVQGSSRTKTLGASWRLGLTSVADAIIYTRRVHDWSKFKELSSSFTHRVPGRSTPADQEGKSEFRSRGLPYRSAGDWRPEARNFARRPESHFEHTEQIEKSSRAW